jgi:Family of unknown function (DUF5994)
MTTPSTTQSLFPDVAASVADRVVHRAGPAGAGPRLRLALSDSIGHGGLDGAWWPQSRNLETELADLVERFPASVGRIVRAVYSTPDWQPAPRRIRVGKSLVRVGSFPRDDNHRILLRLSNRQVLHVMVVPPDSSPSLAHAAMARAASPRNRDCAATILKDAQDAQDAQDAEAFENVARWSDDGGQRWEPRTPLNVRGSS